MNDPFELSPWENMSAEPSLLSKYAKLRATNAELLEALEACEEAIATLGEWDLGHGGQGEDAYPLRDELLHVARAAIAKAEKPTVEDME